MEDTKDFAKEKNLNKEPNLKNELKDLYNKLISILIEAPSEDDCTYEEITMYEDMANLRESLEDVI